ncbi:DUF7024 domain-containing protein [Collimonas arenae]|uniref:DUF7024 domain-containing protein n=1 Tax=Collimonas arenae TaxID=279058 RepID=UPI0007783A4A|nr:hypothetical protein [Collimonas arenae]
MNQPILVSLSSISNDVDLIGFNVPEEWGAWSARSDTVIDLPVQVHGRLKLRLFAWTLPENLNQALGITIGGETENIKLADAGKEYEVVLNVQHVTDRILLKSAIFHPSNSSRDMGVAISHISIEWIGG